MEIIDYLQLLDDLSVEVENELERKVMDTHLRYEVSSSAYNGYDDGHNSGVFTGVELFIEKLKGSVVNASDSPELDRIDILRYRLQGEEVVGISGSGGFGGTTIEFSNGDKIELLHFNHKEQDGSEA